MKVLNSGKLTRRYQQGDSITISDPRKIRATTGQPINPNRDLVSGKYGLDHIRSVVNAAKRYGIDPLTLLAVDMKETTLGKKSINSKWFNGNVGQVNMNDKDIKVHSLLKDANVNSGEQPFDRFARAYLTKQNDANRFGITDEAKRIQLYNGDRLNKDSYGVKVPKGGIDLSKNPLYGKDVLDYRNNVFRKSKDFMRAVANADNPSQIPTGQPTWPPEY